MCRREFVLQYKDVVIISTCQHNYLFILFFIYPMNTGRIARYEDTQAIGIVAPGALWKGISSHNRAVARKWE
jgi:hypothetical protein